MKMKNQNDVEKFIENQKAQLGLSEIEAQNLYRDSLADLEISGDIAAPAAAGTPGVEQTIKKKYRRKPQDPYLSESRTIHARPTRVSKIPSLIE